MGNIKKRPKLKGLIKPVDYYYEARNKNKILRFGIQIDTPPCNWGCPYCYVDKKVKQKKNGIAPLKKIFDWINQGIKFGITGITINGTYEPTLGENLFRLLEYSAKQGLQTLLVTNGTGLTRKNIKYLKEFDTSVLIKLNVPIADKSDFEFNEYKMIQASMVGKPDSSLVYEKILNVLHMLEDNGFNKPNKQRDDIVTSLGIESVITKLNYKYLNKLSGQLRDKNIYSHFEVIKIQGKGAKHKDLVLTPNELKDLFFSILKDDLEHGYEGFQPHPPYIGGACYQNLVRLNITANGVVTPCPGIDVTLGNLSIQPLEEIIMNSKYLNIIRNLEQYVEGDCKTCEHMIARECYAGCRGMAYLESKRKGYSLLKSLVASDPSCWRVNKIFENG